MPDPIETLIASFRALPGIGPRQARRFAYFILGEHGAFAKEFAHALLLAKKNIKQCNSCYRFHMEGGQGTLCNLCSASARDMSTLLIVEKDVDIESIEKSGAYHGTYFILGGLVPILAKIPKEHMREDELKKRIEKDGLKEIIIALSISPDGDYTADYVKKILSPLTDKYGIKVSILGRGLSTGAELEYSDPDTLRSAFKNRG